MPSTVRITGLILLFFLPGNLPAQTSNPSASQPPDDQFDSRPPLLESTTGPAPIAPPVAADNKTADASVNVNKPATPAMPLKRESHALPPATEKGIPRDSGKKQSGLPSMVTLAGSLGVVLGIFLLMAWLMRRVVPQGLTRIPNEAFEVLGRAPLAGRQNVHLLRCGNKLLLVSITPAGAETLTEITDPGEVDRLAGICRQAGPQSSTAAFRRIFEQLAPKRPSRGFLSRDKCADFDHFETEFPDALDWERRNA
jgi:flagellar protein FliO/FliZ